MKDVIDHVQHSGTSDRNSVEYPSFLCCVIWKGLFESNCAGMPLLSMHGCMETPSDSSVVLEGGCLVVQYSKCFKQIQAKR